MTANELISLIPRHVFNELRVETKVDHSVKKLTGEVMFKLLLFSMLNSNKLSLRVLESLLHSIQFKAFAHCGQSTAESRYNSIRDRICTIRADYFETLFHDIFSIYNKELKEEKALSKADSTYVTLSAKLLAISSMQNGKEKGRRHVKYSVVVKGNLPATVKVFTESVYISENFALSAVIDAAEHLRGDVVVFDRGIQSRDAFDRFTADGKFFIGSSKTHIHYKPLSVQAVTDKPATSASLTITADSQG